MENVLAEFLKFLFQPPVLILFCLGIAGLSLMLQDRSEYRFRVTMEWRARETFYRKHAGFNDELIARARKSFFERRRLKEPKS